MAGFSPVYKGKDLNSKVQIQVFYGKIWFKWFLLKTTTAGWRKFLAKRYLCLPGTGKNHCD